MDHMGPWMLPGGAFVLVVVAGIVLVGLDDIATALLNRSRRHASAAESGPAGAASARFKVPAARAWRRVQARRTR